MKRAVGSFHTSRESRTPEISRNPFGNGLMRELRLAYSSTRLAEEDVVISTRIKRRIEINEVEARQEILSDPKAISGCKMRGISRQPSGARPRAMVRAHLLPKTFNFFEMSGFKIFRKGKANQNQPRH